MSVRNILWKDKSKVIEANLTMGNKLRVYINSLHELIDSGKEIEDIELFKQELFREIQFWQHERLVHLLVTFLFAIVTVAVLLVLVFYASIPLLILFVLLLVLLIPYIKHYYILENGVQTLYVMYEEIERRSQSVCRAWLPEEYGIKIKPFSDNGKK